MNLKPISLTRSLNKAYRKFQKIDVSDIATFKANLSAFITELDEKKDEEYAKVELQRFLNNTYYNGKYKLNTKDKIDLAIYEGEKPVVIIEAKRPAKQDKDMVRKDNLNAKAMQQLILYYLEERIEHNNTDIHRLIISNCKEWFIFDVTVFEKLVYGNKALVKEYTEWKNGRKAGTGKDFFYDSIAEEFLSILEDEVEFTHFDLKKEYDAALEEEAMGNEERLADLYKIFSPTHLLKLPFANDSNSLDKNFYAELLHLIGLEEELKGGKKLIGRKPEGKRNPASLLENVISNIVKKERLKKITNLQAYGVTEEEQLFNAALELCITWVNRILFMKLLEAQLINYHKGNAAYRFLDSKTIPNFAELDSLFFEVLARPISKRDAAYESKYARVPYLNSSLFDSTELEEQTSAFISVLNDGLKLPLYKSTVLKDEKGKRSEGELPTLDYLFLFLDAYDFSAEGGRIIQNDNKTLINASVLGLIFEKINGYKDGSFFTPGFITMYMCRETIRRAVVQKFKEAKGWECETFEELYNYIKPKDIKEANSIINDLKLCDPAVGSGHFLVSALNELIAIKSELDILCDREGQIIRDYKVEIVNDELFVIGGYDRFFEYIPGEPKSQRIQEALFHEKQSIIENSLFGVDINPNSVKICNLRLWIELLKHSYYKEDTGYKELETLPNIDINIKCGNSLVSRFSLDADLNKALRSIKYSIDDYRGFVNSYKNEKNRETKRGLQKIIDDIKSNFRTEIAKYSDPRVNKLYKLGEELYLLTSGGLFKEPDEGYGKNAGKRKERIAALEAEINKLTQELDEVKNNPIFRNAFEWRFEFPEVLDANGNFKGFDIVIGNPPYIRQEEIKEFKQYFQLHYKTFAGTADLYIYFIEKGISIIKNKGCFTYIVPNKWHRVGYAKTFREFIKSFNIERIIDFGDLSVFDEATTYPCIISLKKEEPKFYFKAANITTLEFSNGLGKFINENEFDVDCNILSNEGWILDNSNVSELLNKIKSTGVSLEKYIDKNIYRGVLTGFNEAFVISEDTKKQLVKESKKSATIIKPFLAGRDIKRYLEPQTTNYLIFTRREINIDDYPSIKKHLEKFKKQLTPGKEGGRKPGNYKWYEIQDSTAYYQEFEKEKIIYPNICRRPEFTFDSSGCYTNQKCFIIPTSDKHLLGILNSSITFFLFKNILPKLRGDYYEPSYVYLKDFPIVTGTEQQRKSITKLVDKILEAKKANPEADTTKLEKEIDQLVYQLYQLTPEEIQLVEESTK